MTPCRCEVVVNTWSMCSKVATSYCKFYRINVCDEHAKRCFNDKHKVCFGKKEIPEMKYYRIIINAEANDNVIMNINAWRETIKDLLKTTTVKITDVEIKETISPVVNSLMDQLSGLEFSQWEADHLKMFISSRVRK